MPRYVFDTNILVSAYGFGGRPAQLMRAAILGDIELVTSPPLLAELARVLADKMEFDVAHVEAVVGQLGRVADVIRPDTRISVIADEPDNRVLECAVAGSADAIVSGDGHLLELGEFRGIRILRAADVLRDIGGTG